jgi:hypothetical protein
MLSRDFRLAIPYNLPHYMVLARERFASIPPVENSVLVNFHGVNNDLALSAKETLFPTLQVIERDLCKFHPSTSLND